MGLTKAQQRIVQLIRQLHRRRAPLNLAAVKRRHPTLLRQVYKMRPFWGWKRALEAAGVDNSKINVELLDYVTCRLCGKDCGLLNGHLSQVHKLSASDYLEQFPGAELISEELRAHQSRALRRGNVNLPPWEPLWSAEYILDRIAEMHRRGMPLNSGWIQEHEDALLAAAEMWVGPWDEALREAGVDPQEIRVRDPALHLTPQQIVERLRQRKKRGLSVNNAAVHADDLRLFAAIKRSFGDYDAGLRAAGFDPAEVRRVPPKYSNAAAQKLLEAIRATAALPDRDRRRAWRNLQKRYFRLVRSKRFGSWLKVFAEAGVERSLFPISPYDPRNRVPVRFPNRQSVIDEFKRRLRQRLPTHSNAAIASDPVFYKAVIKYFGKYSKLCVLLGQPPRQPRPLRYPDRRAVLDAFQRRIEKGLPINSTAVAKSDGSLASAVRKCFGGYPKLAALLGIPVRKLPGRRYPDQASVVHALQNRLAKRMPITSGALHKSDPSLNESVRRFFGSFHAMYVALGEPKPKTRRYPDAASVLAGLRRRRKQRLSTSSRVIAQSDGALYNSILKFFGGIDAVRRLL
jgi:hypothetical protein